MTDPFSMLPPQNLQAEESVLGCMLLDRSSIPVAGEILTADDFYAPEHRDLFTAIQAMHQGGTPVDAVTLRAHLDGLGLYEAVGGSEKLMNLMEVVPSAANAAYYAKLVRQKSLGRAALRAANAILREVSEGKVSGEDAVNSALIGLREVSMMGGSGLVVGAKQAVASMLSAVDRGSEAHKGRIWTHYSGLDGLLRGLHRGSFVILAGRPSMGKSTLALNLVRANVTRNVPCLFFSLEMDRDDVMMNAVLAHARTSRALLEGDYASDEAWEKFTGGAAEASEWPFYIAAPDSADIGLISSISDRYVRDFGVGLVVVDYLQLMNCARGESRQLEVSTLSRQLKQLARRLNVPVLVLSQLNRAPDQRDDHRPRNSDLRESGSLEQDADVIMFIWRPELYGEQEFEIGRGITEDARGLAEVAVSKNRNGAVGRTVLRFTPHQFRFDESTPWG